MQKNRLHQLYSQSLTWSDQKLHRYLVLRKSPTDVQLTLALALALLSHRLPFYGKDATVLENPEGIAEYLIQSCKDASESFRNNFQPARIGDRVYVKPAQDDLT